MFIVIFKEGNQLQQPLEKNTFEQAYEMPGEKYIFKMADKDVAISNLYIDGGIWCFDDKEPSHFIHDGYHLVHINKYNNRIDVVFRYRDRQTIVMPSYGNSTIPWAIAKAVREIILASKFNSWEEYQKNKADINEINRLKTENDALKKEIEKLRLKLRAAN
jgi:hypothetical protein